MSMVEEIGKGLSGLEQLRVVMACGKRPGIAESLDFDLVEVDEGRAVFAGVPGPHAYNPMGMVHGGYFATLLDSALGCAVHSRMTAQQTYTTLELKVAYHKALTAQSGLVRAEGRVISMGRRVAFVEGSLTDANGKLYATASSTLLVMDR
ncbi:PaaI family thioesterase [Rhodanobacter sp. MP1X3]|uniref:PaaI family thioesterase n=1 Tax=Rhodanobacter sp. MP1X3 TaxID=2723086 RepID=UPI001609F626|nr:PaaI family thioesterase [Rhodanobacter sp. MP1X3]MBB6241605.1 uncharacterized protein (TIGR00369 family) [Rhodanobacter sp. MP1X3]